MPSADSRQRIGFWLPVVAYMGLLFALSSRSTLPAPPDGLSYYHAHFAAYAGLAVLTARAKARGLHDVSWGAVLAAVVISTLYGVSDEYHQMFVPGRTFDALDILADALGAVTGATAARAWGIIRRRSEARNVL